MKFEFRVASLYHFSGANPEYIKGPSFNNYDSAKEYSNTLDECMPTIYLVVDEKYVFYCERSTVENIPYKIYRIQSFEGGQIETKIWWTEFIKNPKKYLHFVQKILDE